MILRKIKYYKNLIFLTLTISLLHIVLGITSLIYLYSSTIDVKAQKKQIQSITNIFKVLDKKQAYDASDLILLTESNIIDNKTPLAKLPSKKDLINKALIEQSKIITTLQSELNEYQKQKDLSLKVLIFSLIITIVFGWILPGLVVKKLSQLLIHYKNDLQTNIEKMISNWKNANLKNNQAAYLILTLQALSLYLSFKGDKTSTQIIMDISNNLNRIFDSQETSI